MSDYLNAFFECSALRALFWGTVAGAMGTTALFDFLLTRYKKGGRDE